MPIRVRVRKEAVTKALTEGTQYDPTRVVRGLPEGCKLRTVCQDTASESTLVLVFDHSDYQMCERYISIEFERFAAEMEEAPPLPVIEPIAETPQENAE